MMHAARVVTVTNAQSQTRRETRPTVKEFKAKWSRIRGLMTPDRFLYLEDGSGGFEPRAWRSACILIGTSDSVVDLNHLQKLWHIYLEKLLIYTHQENEALDRMGFKEFWWLVETQVAWIELEEESN